MKIAPPSMWVLNFVLAAVLLLTLGNRRKEGRIAEANEEAGFSTSPGHVASNGLPSSETAVPERGLATAGTLPFDQLYSRDPGRFAAKLRWAGCPEETVRDILTAEVRYRHRDLEEAIRPTPADHLPAGWSPVTSERRLLKRRQQAGALAARKAAMLRDALGYEVQVKPPLYATSTAEHRFLKGVDAISSESRAAVAEAHEDYWAGVQALQERTQGFWEPEDLAALERLKKERAHIVEQTLNEQEWTEFKLRSDPAVAGFQRELAVGGIQEEELRELLSAARKEGIADLSAALSHSEQATALMKVALGPERATELTRLKQDPELRRFYQDLKDLGLPGKSIPPLYDARQELRQQINLLAQETNPEAPDEVNRVIQEISRAQEQLRGMMDETAWRQAQEKGLFSFPLRMRSRSGNPFSNPPPHFP